MRFLECLKSAGKFSMEAVISGQWWKSHQSLACKGSRILRFCVMSWKDESEPNVKFCLGATVGMVQRFIKIQNFGHNWWRADGIRVKKFPGFTTLQLCNKVHEFMSKLGETEQFQGRIIFMSMFNDIIWWNKDNGTEWKADSTLVSVFVKGFPAGRWSFLGLGSETKRYSTNKERLGGKWDRVAELMMIKFGESGPSFPSNESVLSRNAQKQRRWKIFYTLLCRWWYDWNCFSHNHFCQSAQYLRSSLKNTVAVKQEQGNLLWQSNLTHCSRQQTLMMTTPTFSIEILAQENLLQKHNGRVENLPQPDQLIKICTDAGFLTSSYKLQSQWHVLRKLYHGITNQLTRKVGFEGTPKLDPCWKSQPVTCKVNMERNSQLNLWTKTILPRGSEFLMAWTTWWQTLSLRSTTTTSRRPLQRRRKYVRLQADPRLKQNQEDLQLLAHFQGPYLFLKEHGLMLKQEPSGKKNEHGAIEFWRLKDVFHNKFEDSQYWSDDAWKSKMAGGGGNNKRYQFCTDSSRQEILYLRGLQGHSGRNPIDPSLQDYVLMPNNFFEYIYHIGCAVNSHSITNSGLIPGGQNSSGSRQTVFLKAVNPMLKNHQSWSNRAWPDQTTYCIEQAEVESAPRYGVLGRYSACSTKRIEVLSSKIILYDTLSAYSLCLESNFDEIWRNQKPESVCVTSTTAGDFLPKMNM